MLSGSETPPPEDQEMKQINRKNNNLKHHIEKYPLSKGLEVGLACANSYDMASLGTIQNSDPNAIGI